MVEAYQSILGRDPESAGSDYWTAYLTGRKALELRVLLLASAEYYQARGSTAEAWVEAAFTEILGRSGTASERQPWVDLVEAGVPRADVAGYLYNSDEALARLAEVLYAHLVGRSPSDAEKWATVVALRASGERHVSVELLSAVEAYAPFEPAPPVGDRVSPISLDAARRAGFNAGCRADKTTGNRLFYSNGADAFVRIDNRVAVLTFRKEAQLIADFQALSSYGNGRFRVTITGLGTPTALGNSVISWPATFTFYEGDGAAATLTPIATYTTELVCG
ncbi:MAG: DUF4214 domain-containing protein [Actinomycetota bacterium]